MSDIPVHIVEIHPKSASLDPAARQLKGDLLELGWMPQDAAVETCRLYRLSGALSTGEVEKVARTLLVDPVVETYKVVWLNPPANGKTKKAPAKKKSAGFELDVWPKPGVTDPTAETVEKGLRDLGINQPVQVTSATRYAFPKAKDPAAIESAGRRLLANELIQELQLRPA